MLSKEYQFSIPAEFFYKSGRHASDDYLGSVTRGAQITELFNFFYTHKPNLEHLWVLGFIAYTYVKQGKSEPRAKRCLFVGYPNGVKGYKLWALE